MTRHSRPVVACRRWKYWGCSWSRTRIRGTASPGHHSSQPITSNGAGVSISVRRRPSRRCAYASVGVLGKSAVVSEQSLAVDLNNIYVPPASWRLLSFRQEETSHDKTLRSWSSLAGAESPAELQPGPEALAVQGLTPASRVPAAVPEPSTVTANVPPEGESVAASGLPGDEPSLADFEQMRAHP